MQITYIFGEFEEQFRNFKSETIQRESDLFISFRFISFKEVPLKVLQKNLLFFLIQGLDLHAVIFLDFLF
jgi:hypothetical protein